MPEIDPIATAEQLVAEARAAVDAAANDIDRRDAERRLKQARRRLLFAQVGQLPPSAHLNDSGAPPGSHDKKGGS